MPSNVYKSINGDSGTASYTPADETNWSPVPSTIAEGLDQLAERVANPYEHVFTNASWSGPVSGEYSLSVIEATHLKGVNPTVTVYENIGGGTFERVVTSLTIDNTGLITIKVSSTPDNRFSGKIIITN